MPKEKTSLCVKLKHYTEEFNNFSTDGKVLFCLVCEKNVPCSQRFQVLQHLSTSRHEARASKTTSQKQLLLTEPQAQKRPGPQKSEFASDLCRAMVCADIPIWKLKNPVLCEFLEKYTHETVPDESTIRKNYVPDLYMETIKSIRLKIGVDDPIWVSIDETTDVQGRHIGNVIVGVLKDNEASKPVLLTCEVLPKCNHHSIAKLFNDAMGLLWPDGVKHSNVFLLVTDAAPYMCKAAAALQVLYPKMLHLTCLVHAFHRIAELVRSKFSNVDTLISNTKKVFLKANNRVDTFKELFPELPLPPQPILTRWGSWIDAVGYYAKNFDSVKQVLQHFDSQDAVSVESAKESFSNVKLKNDIAYIQCNFSHLCIAIKSLEASSSKLSESLDVVHSVVTSLESLQGPVGAAVKDKLSSSLKKNPGFKTISAINRILSEGSVEDLEIEYTAEDLCKFKYAPITSCEVERSFSQYKAILRDNRRSFIFENLKHMFVPYCYGDHNLKNLLYH
ncbi:hypothetical protein C0J52_22137 [Blattella germanica]|nr:hypothetical protein C0J52_22137 [Blattella germanica]